MNVHRSVPQGVPVLNVPRAAAAAAAHTPPRHRERFAVEAPPPYAIADSGGGYAVDKPGGAPGDSAGQERRLGRARSTHPDVFAPLVSNHRSHPSSRLRTADRWRRDRDEPTVNQRIRPVPAQGR
jgi:hypothetical protein